MKLTHLPAPAALADGGEQADSTARANTPMRRRSRIVEADWVILAIYAD